MTQTERNYRVGWVIPNQIAALTHYTSLVTSDEFMAIMTETQALLENAETPFHLIIDNYNVTLDRALTLAELKGAAPFMSHPQLCWVVMVVPHGWDDLPHVDQHDGRQHMTYTFTAQVALDHLKTVDDTLRWDMLVADFFPHE